MTEPCVSAGVVPGSGEGVVATSLCTSVLDEVVETSVPPTAGPSVKPEVPEVATSVEGASVDVVPCGSSSVVGLAGSVSVVVGDSGSEGTEDFELSKRPGNSVASSLTVSEAAAGDFVVWASSLGVVSAGCG